MDDHHKKYRYVHNKPDSEKTEGEFEYYYGISRKQKEDMDKRWESCDRKWQGSAYYWGERDRICNVPFKPRKSTGVGEEVMYEGLTEQEKIDYALGYEVGFVFKNMIKHAGMWDGVPEDE